MHNHVYKCDWGCIVQSQLIWHKLTSKSHRLVTLQDYTCTCTNKACDKTMPKFDFSCQCISFQPFYCQSQKLKLEHWLYHLIHKRWKLGNWNPFKQDQYCKTLVRVTLFSQNHRSSFIHETLFSWLVISSSIILTLQIIGEDFIFASLCSREFTRK